MVVLNVTFLFQMYSVIVLSYISTMNVIFIDSYTECHYAGCHIFIVMLYVAFYRHAEYSIFIVILNVMLCVTFLLQC
jgi:hypothetical protein